MIFNADETVTLSLAEVMFLQHHARRREDLESAILSAITLVRNPNLSEERRNVLLDDFNHFVQKFEFDLIKLAGTPAQQKEDDFNAGT